MEIKNLSLANEPALNSDITIRKVVPDDFESVCVLEELISAFHQKARPDYFKVSEANYTREEFEELLKHPCPIALTAVQDEMLVGLCFGKIEATRENAFCRSRRIAFVQDLVTLPAWRGKGIAAALMAEARKQAQHAGAVSLELCVWNFNESALRLYEKLGMKVQFLRMEDDLKNG